MTDVQICFALWMLGVSAAHGLRFAVFKDPPLRQAVAAGGVGIYGLSASLCASHPDIAYGIAVVFPLVGVSSILIGSLFRKPAESTEEKGGALQPLLEKTGIDNWQLAVGVTQFAALLFAARSLWISWFTP